MNIFSSESIEKAKIKALTSKNMLELQKTGFNSFHIDNLPTRVCTLDVIVVKGKIQAAYEGILVIGQISYEVLHKEITTRNTDLDEIFVFQKSVLNNE